MISTRELFPAHEGIAMANMEADRTVRYFEPKTPSLPSVEPAEVSYAGAKRAVDIFCSGLLLLLLMPVFAVIALLVRSTSKGPIFYKSERIGLGGKPFMFIKFRSMRVDAEARLAELVAQNEKEGPIFKMKDDPRITKVGKFLRKYSLDELPQFIHVFTGEMSMVGPRPPLGREVMLYDEDCLIRLSVKPGITCYWQVMGRSKLSFCEWMALDRKYVQDMSFWTDLQLMARTPRAVFFGSGAY